MLYTATSRIDNSAQVSPCQLKFVHVCVNVRWRPCLQGRRGSLIPMQSCHQYYEKELNGIVFKVLKKVRKSLT